MKNLSKFLAVGFCAAVLSACGTQSSRSTLDSTGSNQTTTTTTSGTGNIYNLPAAPQSMVVLSGNNGPSPSKTLSFGTSRTLKVKVQALGAQNLTIAGYTNWSFPYGCLQVNVTVNGSTQSALLSVAGVNPSQACPGAPNSKVLDFTNVMTGNGPVTVSFGNPMYDNCRTYNPFYYGCYMSAVWQNHMVALESTVQTDGTWMDP